MQPRGILILSNDRYIPMAKCAEAMQEACVRLGIPAWVRDSSHPRYLGQCIDASQKAPAVAHADQTIRSTFDLFIDAYEIDAVISPDLQWLFEPGLFTNNPQIAQIHSFWCDDFRSWTKINLADSIYSESLQAEIRHGKVTHQFNGHSQVFEAQALGLGRGRISYLAAPRKFTECAFPCEVRDRAAFIGNPGMRTALPDALMKGVMDGLELGALRQLCADTFSTDTFPKRDGWIKVEPTVRELLSEALQLRVNAPSRGAVELLQQAAAHYPRAYDYLLGCGDLLEAALIVKMVNCCDRPAYVRHLYQCGLVDVYSNIQEWALYGVQARPTVRVNDLPRVFQRYAVHLNAANALRDATANERLFEIAACGRVTANIHSHDVFSCFSEQEVVMGRSFAELEQQVRALLAAPEQTLAMGERARARVVREHLWEHRLADAFRAFSV